MKATWITIMLLLYAACAEATTVFYDAALYITDDPTITLAWDAQPEGNATPDYYDIVAYCIETNQSWGYRATGLEITITKPKVGHFYFTLTACLNAASEGEMPQCTTVTKSSDPTAAIWWNGTLVRSGGWIIYWRLSKPIFE